MQLIHRCISGPAECLTGEVPRLLINNLIKPLPLGHKFTEKVLHSSRLCFLSHIVIDSSSSYEECPTARLFLQQQGLARAQESHFCLCCSFLYLIHLSHFFFFSSPHTLCSSYTHSSGTAVSREGKNQLLDALWLCGEAFGVPKKSHYLEF